MGNEADGANKGNTGQAAYEVLNAAQLKTTSSADRDRIWAATEECGLGSVPAKRSAAAADAVAVGQAAQRNALLRERGLRIPWDHVTEWEVLDYWTTERGLAKDSPVLSQLLRFAAGIGANRGEVQLQLFTRSQSLYQPHGTSF